MPTRPPTSLLHSAFYRFVALPEPRAVAGQLRTLARDLLGSVVVAPEGVSGTLAGEAPAVAAFEAAVQCADVAGGTLRGMAFRHSSCVTEPFGRLKIGVKPELVSLGRPGQAGRVTIPAPQPHDPSRLAPRAWRALLAREDVVVLDNRNHFEYRLGHFRTAVDPAVHNFRDLATYVVAQAPAWRSARRPVAMYCTGGIRCDKAAPWLRGLGLEVLQLDGGILNYFQALPDADRDWLGECFVFDNRVALDSGLRETATTAEQVFDTASPDELWRLQRARRLADAAG